MLFPIINIHSTTTYANISSNDINDLKKLIKKKIKDKEYYFYIKKLKQKKLRDIFNLEIPFILSSIKWQKSMRWAYNDQKWSRPIKSILGIFENKKLNDDISYYLHRPSATDKTMAPEGNDCFYVLVPVPNNQSKIDWSVEGEKMKNLVIDKMQNDLMPDLKNNIVEDFYLTPDYFEKDLNTKYGSGFSIQPKFSQSAYFRFHNKSEIYKGLYFVGAGTHPGAGVPGVLSSAKVLEKIL